MKSAKQEKVIINRIEDLWIEASIDTGDTPDLNEDVVGQSRAFFNISDLMDEAEMETSFGNDKAADDSFEQIKSRFEAVATLQPEDFTDSHQEQNVEYDFNASLSNLVRASVRRFVKSEFEATIKAAIDKEMKSHFADKGNKNHR